MSLPGNGIFVVQGEMAMLVTAMRRSTRWGSHSFPNEEYDVLMRTFQDLKSILNQIDDLRLLDPATYLSPFLEVIRSKETTGPVTSLALSAIHKFLSYGLIDPTHVSVPAIVEDIADAVTHARFVGTDHSSDGVVLMKILQVLRTLMLSPEGAMLTDESVCEIMLSCFRICFETRLTELLRRNAEQCLRDMTQLIFMRLPQLPPEAAPAAFPTAATTFPAGGLSLKKRDRASKKRTASSPNGANTERKSSVAEQAVANVEDKESKVDSLRHSQDKNLLNEAEITIEPVDQTIKSPIKKHGRHSSMDLASNGNSSITQLLEKCVNNTDGAGQTETENKEEEEKKEEKEVEEPEEVKEEINDVPDNPEPDETGAKSPSCEESAEKLEEYVNHRGIRFTPQDEALSLQPYGLACVRELFRFLISLCNPLDTQNTSAMVHLGLSLVGTALEVGVDHIAKYPSLMYLVKDPLCRNLLSLLNTERISLFALDLQVSFLLFEALRFHLKYQMEAFFKKIIEIISTDTTKAIYELKEIHHIALESLAQMFRIPGLCAELYLNFDCDIYCMNTFEELTKLLSKNVVSSTAYNVHSLSLDVVMTIIEAIETGCNHQKVEVKTEMEISNVEEEKEPKYGRGGHVSLELGGMEDASVVSEHGTHESQYGGGGRIGRHKVFSELPSDAELDDIKNMKKWVSQGTELFNQKPERGVEFLQEHGVLATPLDPRPLAAFLRENPDLDKKMIGEYICKRSSRGDDEGDTLEGGVGGGVLSAFANSFDFNGLRIDQALRLYLETFRLPGEAPLIFLVMEKFAERWHSTNGEPFANTDAAFRLAYAVIMLNMDQHNHNAKKLNVPMTVDDFVKNLRGCNGSGDFDQAMLEAIYYSIKNEEMVMPAERVGPVRDAYLWRVLQRRGAGPHARYRSAPPAPPSPLGPSPAALRSLYARLFHTVCPPTVAALSASFERAGAPAGAASAASAASAADAADEADEGAGAAAAGALRGLERCAALLARLPRAPPAAALSLDTLALTLAKFTGLLAAPHASHLAIGVSLGQSPRARLALRRACAVAARHADALREAWRHVLEIVKTLFLGHLLPKCLVEVEDYLSPNGTVSLIREAARGSESGLLSSLYSYIALGESGIRSPSPHEKALIDVATECVARCNLPGLLVSETKFLQLESLQELIHAMVIVGTPPDSESLQLNPQLEDTVIFFLELLGQTLIQNRDRLAAVWAAARAHYRACVAWAGARGPAPAARALTALLRTAARLMRCDHCASEVLQHLRLLFELPYKLFYQQADVISSGLYELVKTSAQNVHSAPDWELLLALLAAAGAGAWPRAARVRLALAAASTAASSRSEDSEDESDRRPTSVSSESELSHSPQTQGWILVDGAREAEGAREGAPGGEGDEAEAPEAVEAVRLRRARASALARCAEALALVVRDVAHVTPHNCRAAVRAVRLLARAAAAPAAADRAASSASDKKSSKYRDGRKSRPSSARRQSYDSSDDEADSLDPYYMVSIQLLDLMHTLHSRTAQIFKWWRDEADQGQGTEDYDLWEVAWKPLLQGIAHFCTDRRKQVSHSAVAYLQRALLAPGLATMGGARWRACFDDVLFPLLERLLRRPRLGAAARVNTTVCKVFLQHLAALAALAAPAAPAAPAALAGRGPARAPLAALWRRVLAAQRALVAARAPDDPLTEATRECLKNMILVMDSVKIFSNGDGYNELWYITWNDIEEFLPNLKEELFPEESNEKILSTLQSPMHPNLPPSMPTLLPVGPTSTPTILPVNTNPTNDVQLLTQTSQYSTCNYQAQSPTAHAFQHPIQIQTSYSQSPTLVQMAHSPVNIGQTVPTLASTPSLVAPTPISAMSTPSLITPIPGSITSIPNVGSTPKSSNAGVINPMSGTVPIRNPLYDQMGLTSSVLLQPLNEMISTPIGMSMQSQIPILYPQTADPHLTHITNKSDSNTNSIKHDSLSNNIIVDINEGKLISHEEVQHSELYTEYITNPYNDTRFSHKEATLYDPEDNRKSDQTVPDAENLELRNPLLSVLDKQKSLSANTTPMHNKTKTQFGSSDNVRQDSGIFNFASYFGSDSGIIAPGSEVFDTLMSTQDG